MTCFMKCGCSWCRAVRRMLLKWDGYKPAEPFRRPPFPVFVD